MNSRHPIILGLLATALAAGAAGSSDRETPPAPAAIVLNGITTVLGDNRACFRVFFTGGLREMDFMLAPGQARYGIRLLAVDAHLNSATISSQGLTRTLPICKTPTLLSGADRPPIAKAAGANPLETVSSAPAPLTGLENRPAADAESGRTAAAVASGGVPPNGSANNPSGNHADDAPNRSTAGPADPGDVAGSSPGGNNSPAPVYDNAVQDYHWWEKEAEKIEQAREATAQQVLDGTLQPYPLTPLTPSDTPSSLIGTNRAFFYFDPLAAGGD